MANLSATLPALVAPRADARATVLAGVAHAGVEIDFWHVLDREDDALVADEVMHGARSGAFIYMFEIAGTKVEGISVVGAAYLARKYGGLKHRMVSSVEKRGGLFRFTSYPAEGIPMQVTASFLADLADEPDHYTVLCEIADIKTGNTVQAERTELRLERRRDGSQYERPNFTTIAQSKAYRNAVLRIIPPDVQAAFKAECVKLGKSKDISKSVIDEARGALLAFAARHGVPLAREHVFALGMAEIDGLRAATRDGADAFEKALAGLGLAVAATAADHPARPAAAKAVEAPADKPADDKPAADGRPALFGEES